MLNGHITMFKASIRFGSGNYIVNLQGFKTFSDVMLINHCFRSVGTPRDGNWGTWSGWTNCSRACNGGTRIRYRFCDSPSPQYGGKVCEGERLLEEPCNEEPCPRKYDKLYHEFINKGNVHPSPYGITNVISRGCFLLYMIASPSPCCNVYNCM